MYKAVIFDLDGTLLDSLDDIVSVLNQTLKKFGMAPVTRARAMTYIGNGARELVRLAIGEDNCGRLDEVLSVYKTAYAACDDGLAKLYKGEKETLRELKERGVKLAVLTNKPHAAALKAEEIFFKEFAFDCFQGQEDGLPLKPSPEAVYRIIDKLGVKKEECLLVGDGETDVMTARNAGVDCASVLWGYRTREQLAAAGATRLVCEFRELKSEILRQ